MLVSTVYVTRQTTISIVILELPKNEIGSLAPNNDSLGPNTQILSVFSEYLVYQIEIFNHYSFLITMARKRHKSLEDVPCTCF